MCLSRSWFKGYFGISGNDNNAILLDLQWNNIMRIPHDNLNGIKNIWGKTKKGILQYFNFPVRS